jgi:hypothetical protein
MFVQKSAFLSFSQKIDVIDFLGQQKGTLLWNSNENSELQKSLFFTDD